jgi:hypothetical protein
MLSAVSLEIVFHRPESVAIGGESLEGYASDDVCFVSQSWESKRCNGSGLVRTTLYIVSSPEMRRLISLSALISRQTMQSPSSSNTVTKGKCLGGIMQGK